MIDEDFLKDYAKKARTTFLNVVREYLQHLFLTNFYRRTNSENFLFKGGTALKLVFGSPRFSEDIDFSGLVNSQTYEKILEEVLEDFSREGIEFDLSESKMTSGGHLAIFQFKLFGQELNLRNEISFRRGEVKKGELFLVSSSLVPAYNVYLLPKERLVAEKIKALLIRRKPRDFFDLYYILRNEELRRALRLEKEQREKILLVLEKEDPREIGKELKALLPIDFWKLIKNLPEAIKNQLG